MFPNQIFKYLLLSLWPQQPTGQRGSTSEALHTTAVCKQILWSHNFYHVRYSNRHIRL